MILLLGASGYLGRAFADELRRRGYGFIPLTRRALDYGDFSRLFNYVRKVQPEFLINAAGYPGRPNLDACESAHELALSANTLLPQTIARVCLMTHTAWGHVSSSGIYTGAKVFDHGVLLLEKDLNQPRLRQRLAEQPEFVRGFTEGDAPNFTFRDGWCNFYNGTKALAEEMIRGVGRSYLWRPGILFSEQDEPRNLLTRIQQYPKVYDSINSLSHAGDFARACLNLWEREAAFGVYNVVNPGVISNREVVEMIQRILKPQRQFEFWKDEREFYHFGARAPRSHCLLDITKLLNTGEEMRPVTEALEDTLHHWHAASPPAALAAP